MKRKYWAIAGRAACFGGVAWVVYAAPAAGQDAGEPSRTEEAPSVVFDPAIAARLEQLQADRRARREQELKAPQAWADNRPARATQDRSEIGQIWGNLVDSPDARAALRIHADRMARLNRMLDVAEQAADATLIKRVQLDIQRELVTHAHKMQTLRATLGGI